MPNNEKPKPNSFRKFFLDKGYYIVLLLCAAAIGVSGYFFLSDAAAQKDALSSETMSVATTVKEPDSSKKAQQTAKQETEESATKSESSSDAAVRAAAASVRVWPVSGSQIGQYSMESLSYNPTTRDWRTHDGVDLAAVVGTPVLAAGDGTVRSVYEDEYLGTTVVIAHTEGYTTQYSNLAAKPAVSVGATVKAGQTIGSVGETAMIESGIDPHLHFAVYQGGAAVDPASFVEG